MPKQTAIDWLLENLPERFKNAMLNTCAEEIKQAKQMQKEQIINAYNEPLWIHVGKPNVKAEDYYNQEYNSNE
jgi:hypothetical protein